LFARKNNRHIVTITGHDHGQPSVIVTITAHHGESAMDSIAKAIKVILV
jgi:hypothetical protein